LCNKAGRKINALPLLIFHNVALVTNRPYYTNAELFDQLMKYLYENHFKVLSYKQLGYNTQTNTFYLNESNPANLTKFYSISVTGMNGIIPKQSSAITQSNGTVVALSSNSSSYLFQPTPLINHLSVPTTSATSSASSDSSSNTGHHLHRFSASTSASVSSDSSSNRHHLHNIYGKDHPNGKSSKHGGYCSYSDYKSNLIRCT
jgi:hypothetical protein